MKLWIRVEGVTSASDRKDIARRSLPILKNHGIVLDGVFSFSGIPNDMSIRVNQYQNKFTIGSDPIMLILGLKQNEWFGDRVRVLELVLEAATGIPTIVVAN